MAWQRTHSLAPGLSQHLAKEEQETAIVPQKNNNRSQNQNFRKQFTSQKLMFIHICFPWNRDLCQNASCMCVSQNGCTFRQVCDQPTDPNNMAVLCSQNHKRVDNH